MPLSLLQVTEQPRATRSWTRVHRRQERFPGLKHFLRWQCSMQIRLQLTTLGCDCTAFSGDGRDARTNPQLLRRAVRQELRCCGLRTQLDRPFAPPLKVAAPEIIFLGPSSGGYARNGQNVANGKFDRYSVLRLSFRLLQKQGRSFRW
jgi:hypothetical protein